MRNSIEDAPRVRQLALRWRVVASIKLRRNVEQQATEDNIDRPRSLDRALVHTYRRSRSRRRGVVGHLIRGGGVVGAAWKHENKR